MIPPTDYTNPEHPTDDGRDGRLPNVGCLNFFLFMLPSMVIWYLIYKAYKHFCP